MTDNYLMIDVNDPRSDKIAEAISNKTSKKILNLLAEKEMSASDLAENLNVPLNTVGYNLDKLVDSGLIEEVKGFFWSVKGKKIKSYKLSNKKIVISPKSFTRGIVPTVVLVGLASLGIFMWEKSQAVLSKVAPDYSYSQAMGNEVASTGAVKVADAAVRAPMDYNVPLQISSGWAWFLLGALVALVIFLAINFKRKGRI